MIARSEMPTPLEIARARVAAKTGGHPAPAVEPRSAWEAIKANGYKDAHGRRFGALLVTDAIRAEQGEPGVFAAAGRKRKAGSYTGPARPYRMDDMSWNAKKRERRAATKPVKAGHDAWAPYVLEEGDGDDGGQVPVVPVDRSALANVWDTPTERVYGTKKARRKESPWRDDRSG
jgi:hypothetical protein